MASAVVSGCAAVKSAFMRPEGTYQGEIVCGKCEEVNSLAGGAFCKPSNGGFEAQELFKKIDTKIVVKKNGGELNGNITIGLRNSETGDAFSDVDAKGRLDGDRFILENSSAGDIPVGKGLPKELLSNPRWEMSKADWKFSGNSVTALRLKGDADLIFRADVMSKNQILARMKCSVDMKKRRLFGL